MTTLNYTVKFHKTVLASFIGLCISQSCFALEAMSDEKLGDTTGEGIALLPQDAYMVFRGAGPNDSNILTDRSKDTGYIHYLPVGPLTSLVQDTNKDGRVNSQDHSVGKADLYMYGLALSKNANNDSNSRLDSANSKIGSWGTPINPWLLNVKTDKEIPNFGTGTTGDTQAKKESLTYLNFEAPLYDLVKPTTVAGGMDAYNLKLALWADAFVLDQSKPEGDSTQFNLGQNFGDSSDSSRANRIRLQAIWNGFGINGSRLQLFQTLGGADNSNGMSKFYNNTLGLSGVLRFNSGDATNVKATVTNGGIAQTLVDTSTTRRFSTAYPGAPWNAGQGDPYMSYRLQTVDTAVTEVGGGWVLPGNIDEKVLRLSTREASPDSQGLLTTPALNSGVAPKFEANEGVFIYNLNTNLVLGSIYQPLTVSSDGKNFSLEIARIPNKPEVYQKIYTDYDNPNSTTYSGSTCNVYQCGTSTITGYQGNSATHSSISIGTVYSSDGGKTLLADSSAGALGISFGKLVGGSSSGVATKYGYQLQVQYRQPTPGVTTGGNTWQYLTGITGGSMIGINPATGKPIYSAGATPVFVNGGSCNETAGSANCYDFNSKAGNNWFNVDSFVLIDSNSNGGDGVVGGVGPAGGTDGKFTIQFGGNGTTRCQASGSGCKVEGYRPDIAHSAYNVLVNAPCKTGAAVSASNCYIGPASNQWAVDAWGGMQQGSTPTESIKNAYGASWNGTTSTWTSNPISATPKTTNFNPLNNLGSAVIDGMLIQHMKITTKGL